MTSARAWMAVAALLLAGGVAVAFVVWPVAHSPAPVPPPPQTPIAVARVWIGTGVDRDVLLRRRFADAGRATFTDRALADALGPAASGREFVEVWVQARDAALPAALHVTRVTRADGSALVLTSIRGLVSGPVEPRVEPILGALAPAAGAPLGKNALRRAVFALPVGATTADLAAVSVDGVVATAHTVSVAALEHAVEEPGQPLSGLVRAGGTVSAGAEGLPTAEGHR